MSYTALPMGDLWRRLAAYDAFAACSLVQDTARRLGDAAFCAAFAQAVEQAQTDGLLPPSARGILLEFGEGCGRTDLAGQQAHIAYYRSLLAAQAADARRNWQDKGRVYRVLGITGGAALMLLLM